MRKSQLIVHTERKWLLPFFASLLISFLLLVAVLIRSGASTRSSETPKFVFESRSMDEMPAPPRLAYLITGSKGDGERIKRLLHAIYHPRNQYLLHLDREAPDEQRLNLGFYLQSVPLFSAAGNVNVIGKADFVSYMGPTAIASTLHGAAIFLRYAQDWDWLINLSALDYPLITQDDLLHVLSYLPRDLNFIQHTSDIGQKEYHTVKPIVIDTGLFSSTKSEVFYATQRRMMPNAFKHFTGSAFALLSRNFIEYCILGWDNLPRTVLLYSANILQPQESYFQTVICNAPEFKNTTVNSDLHYLTWNTSSKPEPYYLNVRDYKKMVQSGAAFARPFHENDPVLDKIDRVVLHRRHGLVAPGGWCVGKSSGNKDPCSVWGNISILKPGTGAKRFKELVLRLVANETFRSNQCKFV